MVADLQQTQQRSGCRREFSTGQVNSEQVREGGRSRSSRSPEMLAVNGKHTATPIYPRCGREERVKMKTHRRIAVLLLLSPKGGRRSEDVVAGLERRRWRDQSRRLGLFAKFENGVRGKETLGCVKGF